MIPARSLYIVRTAARVHNCFEVAYFHLNAQELETVELAAVRAIRRHPLAYLLRSCVAIGFAELRQAYVGTASWSVSLSTRQVACSFLPLS